MKTLLLTGLSGFLGWNICKLFKDEWEIHGTYHKNEIIIPGVKTHNLNLSDENRLRNVFLNCRPDAVIHLAALSAPNYCELHQNESYIVNVRSTKQITDICSQKNIPFVFTSSDLVFDGNHPFYHEASEVNPLSIYAQHKALAEKYIIEKYPKAAICRMPLMFGESGPLAKSWLQDILYSLQKKQ
jgi:dTDP-4-dehydrorhamnose reductase